MIARYMLTSWFNRMLSYPITLKGQFVFLCLLLVVPNSVKLTLSIPEIGGGPKSKKVRDVALPSPLQGSFYPLLPCSIYTPK